MRVNTEKNYYLATLDIQGWQWRKSIDIESFVVAQYNDLTWIYQIPDPNEQQLLNKILQACKITLNPVENTYHTGSVDFTQLIHLPLAKYTVVIGKDLAKYINYLLEENIIVLPNLRQLATDAALKKIAWRALQPLLV